MHIAACVGARESRSRDVLRHADLSKITRDKRHVNTRPGILNETHGLAMAQKEVFPVRSKSFKVADPREEKLAREIIRSVLQPLKKVNEKGPPKEITSNGVSPRRHDQSNGDLLSATSTPQNIKPSKLELSNPRLSPILQSPSMETQRPDSKTPETSAEVTPFCRLSTLRHSAHPSLESRHRGIDQSREDMSSTDQRMRSNSSVQITSVPPDQVDQIPAIIADELRYIADNRIQMTAEQQHTLDRVSRLLMTVEHNNDVLQWEFRQLLDNVVLPENADKIETTLSAFVEAFIIAKAFIQGVQGQDPRSMDDLIQRLEDVVFDVFKNNHVPTLIATCRTNMRRVLNYAYYLYSLSPQLSRSRKTSTSSLHSDSPLERSLTCSQCTEESGIFEQSQTSEGNSVSSPLSNSTSSPSQRRTSSFSNIFMESLTVCTSSVPQSNND